MEQDIGRQDGTRYRMARRIVAAAAAVGAAAAVALTAESAGVLAGLAMSGFG